jgi:predicted ATP-grasp superfamily ATP-dependent carboligase
MVMKAYAEQKPHAIVTGLEYMQGIQAARILSRRHHLPVIAICEDINHPYAKTNCCENVVSSKGDLIGALMDIGKSLPQKSVLYPGTDGDVLMVSRNRQQLSEYFFLCLPKPQVVEMLMDKLQFYAFAQKSGFRVPDTWFVYNRDDLEKAVKTLCFPCVLKPHMRTAEWNRLSPFKAFKINTLQQLLAIYERYENATGCFILQNWIEGPDANLFSCNAYFDAAGGALATFVARKLRQWPPEMGQSSLGEECRNDFVLHETLRLFQTVGFHGLAYLEIKRDQRSGDYFMVEPNICRPTGRSAIAEAGGVDLLYTMYCDALGLPLPPDRVQQYRGVKWINLRQDLRSALYYWRKGELSVPQWRESLRGRKTFAIFSWSDPRPFVGDLWRSVRLFINSSERRRHRPDEPSREKT